MTFLAGIGIVVLFIVGCALLLASYVVFMWTNYASQSTMWDNMVALILFLSGIGTWAYVWSILDITIKVGNG